MIHYIIELALWSLGLFLAGCLIGGIARHLFGPGENKSLEETKHEETEAEKA